MSACWWGFRKLGSPTHYIWLWCLPQWPATLLQLCVDACDGSYGHGQCCGRYHYFESLVVQTTIKPENRQDRAGIPMDKMTILGMYQGYSKTTAWQPWSGAHWKYCLLIAGEDMKVNAKYGVLIYYRKINWPLKIRSLRCSPQTTLPLSPKCQKRKLQHYNIITGRPRIWIPHSRYTL